jgi:NIMA (never in mitosis gene a)-related kinase
MLMQFACGGDLNQKAELQKKLKKGLIPENQVLDWITQIALGLYYLHEKNIIHCDIKLENIFLTYFNDVKIGDFGIGFFINPFTKC